eukprot:2668564-Alexandrium_andersonii.AAC.1
MEDSAIVLLASAHGLALRALCNELGQHYNGLTVAARFASKQKLINGKMCKVLSKLDNAYAFARHITAPKIDHLREELTAMIAASRGVDESEHETPEEEVGGEPPLKKPKNDPGPEGSKSQAAELQEQKEQEEQKNQMELEAAAGPAEQTGQEA